MSDGHKWPQPRVGGAYGPLIGSTGYLLGTFLLFLLVGQVDLVSDRLGLCAFVLLCVVFFVVGYFLKMRSYSDFEVVPPHADPPTGWIRASAAYYAIYGAALLMAYGATGPLAVLDAIRHPGSAYLAKFKIYDLQNATGQSNLTIQLMTLLAVLYTPLIPFLSTLR